MNVPDDIIFQMKALDSIKLHELQKLKTRPAGLSMMPTSDLAIVTGPPSQAIPAISMRTSTSSLDMTCDETLDCYDDTSMIDSVQSSPAMIHPHQCPQSWQDYSPSSEMVYTCDDTNVDAYSSSGMLSAIRAPIWQADNDALQPLEYAVIEGNDVFCSPFMEHWLSSAPFNLTTQELSQTAKAIADFCEQQYPQRPVTCTRKRAADPVTESELRCHSVVNMKKIRV